MRGQLHPHLGINVILTVQLPNNCSYLPGLSRTGESTSIILATKLGKALPGGVTPKSNVEVRGDAEEGNIGDSATINDDGEAETGPDMTNDEAENVGDVGNPRSDKGGGCRVNPEGVVRVDAELPDVEGEPNVAPVECPPATPPSI